MLDYIVRDGFIISGNGTCLQKQSIGIKGDKIVEIDNGQTHEEDLRCIDATGLYVIPGVIDMHTHSDFNLILDKRAESYLRQGITTEAIGNCGFSAAPLYKKANLSRNVFCYKGPYEPKWHSFKQYLDILEQNIAINVVPLVGHSAIRSSVMGYENREATEAEIKLMEELLYKCFDGGARGFSTGIEYFPGSIASKKEIEKLCQITKENNGLYATHVRNRDKYYKDGFKEALEIAMKTGVRLQISHGAPKYGVDEDGAIEIIKMIEKESNNIDIGLDVIPYVWGPTTITALLPSELLKYTSREIAIKLHDEKVREEIKKQKNFFWALVSNGKWEEIILYHCTLCKELKGKTIGQISQILNKSPLDAILYIISKENEHMFSTLIMGKIKNQKDLDHIIKNKLCGVISDAMSLNQDGVLENIRWSPACYSWVPKYIKEYVFEKKLFTLEEAIQKITSYPAKRLNLHNRGMIKENYFADIAIIDIDKFTKNIKDDQYSQGIKYLFVNGKLSIKDDAFVSSGNGKVI